MVQALGNALRHGRADRTEQVEAVAVLVAKIDGGRRDAARCDRGRSPCSAQADHLVDLEHVREQLADLGDAGLEVISLAEEELVNPRLDLGL